MTSLQKVEPKNQDLENENTLNSLADYVVSEERPALGLYSAKREGSETVKAADVRDAMAGISYNFGDVLDSLLTAIVNDGKPNGDNRMVK